MTQHRLLLHEMSLRDWMHPKRHQIPLERMVAIAKALGRAGMPLIEVPHGDGLGGGQEDVALDLAEAKL